MVSFPPAKINLGLQVLSKRPDGYHEIRTCLYPLPCTDVLEILRSETLVFSQTGITIPGKPEDNLCLQSYHLLKKDFHLPAVQIHLHKIIPPGAGLGGGSSDAAHTFRLLDSAFELGLSFEKLSSYAQKVGSDCAFFLQDKPALGKGRGEILEPVPLTLEGSFLVLVKPDIHISTAAAYGGITPQKPSHEFRQLLSRPCTTWKGVLKNDFELPLFHAYPALLAIKEKLYTLGAMYASLSGSGATVFGIFEKEINREDHFKDAWGWSGWL